ncbi:MAG: DUF885 family protein [Bacteroidota bacterium]
MRYPSFLYFRPIQNSLCLILALSLFACEESPKEEAKTSEDFKAYMASLPQEVSSFRPAYLEEFGKSGYTLNSISQNGQQRRIDLLKSQLDKLQAAPALQDSVRKIANEADIWAIKQIIAGEKLYLYEDPLSPRNGFHAKLMRSFHEQVCLTKEETEDYNARLKMVPGYIRDAVSLLQAREAAGIFSSEEAIKDVKKEIEELLAREINQHPIYRGLAIKLNGVNPTEMNLYQAGDYLAVTESNLKDYFIPAYEKILPILDELSPAQNKEASESFYQWKLNSYCGEKVEPELLFTEGQHKLDSLNSLLAFVDADIKESGRKRKIIEKRKRNRVEKVQMFASDMRKAREQMISLFDSLPQRSPEIMLKPSHLSGDFVIKYETASLDQVRKARIVVDEEKWQELNAFEQSVLLYKNLYPGTHTLKQLSDTEVSYIDLLDYPAWEKGWQEYVLRLANEPLYLFSENPYSRKDYLELQILQQAAMLADIGIHHKSWSSKEAEDFLRKNAFSSTSDLEEVLLQIFADPGFYTATTYGADQFSKLMAEAQVRYPNKLTFKSFHSICFAHGPLPWNLLKRLVNVYGTANLER